MTTYSPELPPGSNPLRQLTIAQAAELLNYGKSTLYRMVRARELPSVGEGRLLRILERDILAWQERNRKGGE